MSRESSHSQSPALVAAYLSICVALAMLAGLGIWGGLRQWDQKRLTFLAVEVSRFRSHAERTAGRIESDLAGLATADLGKLAYGDWLRPYWARVLRGDRSKQYGAIVDGKGTIVFHSDPGMQGRRWNGIGTGACWWGSERAWRRRRAPS